MKKRIFLIILGLLIILSIIFLPTVVDKETTIEDIYSNTYQICMQNPSLSKNACGCIAGNFKNMLLQNHFTKNEFKTILQTLQGEAPFNLEWFEGKINLEVFEQSSNQCILDNPKILVDEE